MPITARQLFPPHPEGGGMVVETVEVTGAAAVANDTVIYNAQFPVLGVRGALTAALINKNAITLKTYQAFGNEKVIVDIVLDTTK
jgi:hypothetical protein